MFSGSGWRAIYLTRQTSMRTMSVLSRLNISCLGRVFTSTVAVVFSFATIVEPEAAETLNVGGTELPASLGNPYAAIGVTPGSILGSLYDGLTQIDSDGSLQPALALSWENDGDRRWTFTLRPDVTFQNGAPLTAVNVAANITTLIQPENAGYPIATEMVAIESARALDDDTIEVITRVPDPMLAKRFSLLRIVDYGRWTEIGSDAYAQAPIGTGPYALESWNQGGAIAFTAFDKSWRKPKAFSHLRIFTLKDSIARTQALIAGQIDLALGLTPEDAPIIKAQGLNVQIHYGNQVMAIGLPNALKENSPLNDKRVRQAINHAINRQAIVNYILGGMFPLATQGATPANVGYNPDIAPYSYDPDRARALLAEAGYADGFEVIIEVLVGMGPSDSLIYQQAAQDLSQVGIKVDLRTTTYPERTRKYFSGDWGKVDGFSILWNNAPYNDTGRALKDFSCLKSNPFFCDESLTAQIEESNREMDPDRRAAHLREIMAGMQDLAPTVNLIEYGSVLGYSSRIKNVRIRPVGIAYELIELVD
jgi:peptide/nickel transport system substrate-binding protein